MPHHLAEPSRLDDLRVVVEKKDIIGGYFAHREIIDMGERESLRLACDPQHSMPALGQEPDRGRVIAFVVEDHDLEILVRGFSQRLQT